MKPIEKIIKGLLTLGIIIVFSISIQAQHERKYYGVEIDEVLCGYATTDINSIQYRGSTMTETSDTINILLKALGSDMNMQIISKHIFNTETYQLALNQTKIVYSTGTTEVQTEVFDNYALRSEGAEGIYDTITDIADVIFDNPLMSPHIMNDFVQAGEKEKTYRVYDYVRGYIADQKFTLLSEEDITLAGQEFTTLVINTYNTKDGTNVKSWIDKESGMTVKFEIMNRRIYLADESVIKGIRTVDLDNTIFAKVNKKIVNFTEMSYLKVSADIKSAGEEISVESLNFPGQKFEGTVFENHIQGVFEIEPLWYDGANAPPFPPHFSTEEALKKYLEPELFIESDHPDIIAEAEAITEGAANAWEAVIRLSEWVGREISGAIPGGTTAINTYKIRQGECGSHSRLLTAFCRAVGIPSRLSIGCMYSTWYGGSFGQHAWTEVYMGEEIGWLAVDATILEFDYVDAGHIKLGENASFNPENMEILAYNISGEESSFEDNSIPEEYKNIIGPYTNPQNRNVLEVQYSDGGIGVDIMGRMVLALKDADEEGRRYAQLSSDVYFSFPEDETGQIEEMIIVEKVFAMKKADEDITIDETTPEHLKPFIGPYIIFQIQKEFTVIWDEGILSMLLPDVEDPRPLEKTETEHRWKDPVDLKEYSFKLKDDGTVSGMEIHVTSVLEKGASAAWIIEKSIEENGLEAAEVKFRELWDNRALDLDHTEGDLNNLGYKYMGAGQMDEALMVFKLNADAYPQSWNVYDSYAEALAKNGEFEAAIINYQKSLELNPENENGKEALDGLLSMDKK